MVSSFILTVSFRYLGLYQSFGYLSSGISDNHIPDPPLPPLRPGMEYFQHHHRHHHQCWQQLDRLPSDRGSALIPAGPHYLLHHHQHQIRSFSPPANHHLQDMLPVITWTRSATVDGIHFTTSTSRWGFPNQYHWHSTTTSTISICCIGLVPPSLP